MYYKNDIEYRRIYIKRKKNVVRHNGGNYHDRRKENH